MKSGNLNFLELSRLLQACNETALALALPLPFTYVLMYVVFYFCPILKETKLQAI
jgi:hypothetical protein